MRIVFYNEGQEHSKKVLVFLTDLFRASKPEVVMLAVEKEGSKGKALENKLKKDCEFLNNQGYASVKYKIFAGPPEKFIKQEMKQCGDCLLVKSLSDLNPIIAEIAEQDVDELALKIISALDYSFLLIKNSPKELRKVLICTDGSVEAERAIEYFANLVAAKQPLIKIINIIPATFSCFKNYLEPAAESDLEALVKIKNQRTAYLYRAREILSKYGLKAKIKLRTGHTTEQILKEAKGDFDLIVVGLRGRKSDRKKILGRHTQEILTQAKTSVLAIKS